jgi:hypothetical protein
LNYLRTNNDVIGGITLKLYELSQNYVQLLELADSLDQETFQDTLSSLEEAIEDKAENVAKLIKCLDSDCKAIKEEEQAFSGSSESS